MTFMEEIYHLKKIFRDIEKFTKTGGDMKCVFEVNRTCLTNEIFPEYLSQH